MPTLPTQGWIWNSGTGTTIGTTAGAGQIYSLGYTVSAQSQAATPKPIDRATFPKDKFPKLYEPTKTTFVTMAIEDFISRGLIEQERWDNVQGVLDKVLLHGGWVAGGFFERLLHGKDPNDIDVFFPSYKDWKKAVVHFINDYDLGILPQKNYDSLESTGYVFGNEAVESLERYDSIPCVSTELDGFKIQFCKATFHPTLKETLDSFDFTACQFGFDQETGLVTFNVLSLGDVSANRLVLHRLHDPVSSFSRVEKYQKRGYAPDKGLLAKMADIVSEEKDSLYWRPKEKPKARRPLPRQQAALETYITTIQVPSDDALAAGPLQAPEPPAATEISTQGLTRPHLEEPPPAEPPAAATETSTQGLIFPPSVQDQIRTLVAGLSSAVASARPVRPSIVAQDDFRLISSPPPSAAPPEGTRCSSPSCSLCFP